MKIWRLVAAIVAATAALGRAPLHLAAAEKYDRKTAEFSIAYKGEVSPYRDAAAFVLPRAAMQIDIVGGPAGEYKLTTDQGIALPKATRSWRWEAPSRPGIATVKIDGPGEKRDTITLRVFVMVPASDVRNGLLNGYRIGDYPPKPLKGNPIYLPPPGFVEITRENQDAKVSPHFELKQFICKEDTSDRFPKYVVLQERLPLKLEAILEHVNVLGFKTDTLHVMSGYRTPYYNRAIGDVQYSMHQWGSAADIFVDPENKGRMEDLNHDRRVDIADSKYLYDQIEQLLVLKPFQKFQGGMGYYPATSAHPPFVHVDVRGAKARWKG